jgi:exonuclease SbcC
MRLHRLTMTAIGPFAGQVEIDFSRLGESGLFLLEGPTGSGKSTVIDAISFALYGKVAQSSGVVERMKSHHSAPGTEPVVELVFETQSGLYRVRRTPSFERPKTRGAGNLTANMTVKIFRLSSPDDLDGGELISNKIGDAEDEITRAIGLTHPQFAQTVVLPQGEFANFLRADTNTKRALLQRLFGTELLARTQERLIEGRRIALQQREAASKAITGAVHAFVAAAEVPADTADEIKRLAEAPDDDELATRTGLILDELRSAATAAAKRNKAASTRRTSAQRACQHAADLHSRRERREKLRAREQQLLAANEQHEQARAELAAAERALPVVPVADALATAIGRLDSAHAADSSARSALPDQLSVSDETQLRAAAATRRTRVGELADETRREQELAGVRETCAQVEQHDELLAATASVLRSDLDALPAQTATLKAALDAAATSAAHLSSLREECERAEQRVRAAKRAVIAERQAKEEEQITLQLLEACEQQSERLAVLHKSRLLSIAGDLGLKLQPGIECAVCGSVEHPKPAKRRAGHVSDDQVERAESELKQLRTTADIQAKQLEQQRLELGVLQVEADSMSPEHAQSRLDDVAIRLETARAAAAHQQQLTGQLSDLETRLADLTDQLQRIELNRAGFAERLTALRDRIASDEAMVTEARGDHPTVADLVRDLTNEIARLDAAATAAGALAAATAAEFESGAAFAAALDSAKFSDAAAWHDARRTSAAIATLRAHIKTIDADWAGVCAGLAEPALNDPVLDHEPADLAALADVLEQADSAAEATAADFGSARDRAELASTHADLLGGAAGKSRQLLLDTAATIRVGNLVSGNGDNQLKMELTTYVLVRRFAEIISAANTQLRRVSGGRYELQHTDAKSGNARSGLGLLVLDLHTGRSRDPATLSGGETFYVSLSLALGLADVVRAESGGIELGTLFIDEGFGSLDPEVLDEVMAVLDSLRAGGRAVGVVSHVAELKARISDRIEIRPNADGSSRLRATA